MRPHPHLLEISAWPWLERLSRDRGQLITLRNVPGTEWDRVAAGGLDLVFLMGVWRRSAIGRAIAQTDAGLMPTYDRVLPAWTGADVVGSPYSIQAYTPDDRMGGWPGLDAARHELRTRGIGLILDFVPNHTGFDHDWLSANPALYVQGTEDDNRAAPGHFRAIMHHGTTVFVACARDPYFAPWTDVAQLNAFNPETRLALRETLHAIRAHCDGVRCDMAMLALNEVFERTWRVLLRDHWPQPAGEFWPAAIRETPQFLYLAEVYWSLENVLLDQGFDAAYDKRLLDGLHAPDAGIRTRSLLAAGTPPPARLARFLENHDEPRSAVTLAGRLEAAVSLLATSPGMRFFFDGQMDGRRINPPVQLGRWPDETPDADLRSLYDRVLGVAAGTLWHDGEWKLLDVSTAGDPTFTNIVSWRWRTSTALGVVVVNLGSEPSTAYVALAGDLHAGPEFDFDDRLTDVRYRRTRQDLERTGLYVRLEGGRAHLFLVEPSAAMMGE